MNRELESEFSDSFYVIVVSHKGETKEKYISKDFLNKSKWDLTIKLNKAKRFGTDSGALKWWNESNHNENLELIDIQVIYINTHITTVGKEICNERNRI